MQVQCDCEDEQETLTDMEMFQLAGEGVIPKEKLSPEQWLKVKSSFEMEYSPDDILEHAKEMMINSELVIFDLIKMSKDLDRKLSASQEKNDGEVLDENVVKLVYESL